MTKAADTLKRTLNDMGKNNTPEGVVWAIVKSVDWDAKTMDVKGVKDNLEYYDVLLGIGNQFKRPAVGTKVLIGTYENKNTSMYLVDAEDVEETIIINNESEFIMNDNGFIIKQGGESLRTVLNDLIDNINKQNEDIRKTNQELQKVIVVNGTTPNVPALSQIVTTLTNTFNGNNAVKDRLNSILIA